MGWEPPFADRRSLFPSCGGPFSAFGGIVSCTVCEEHDTEEDEDGEDGDGGCVDDSGSEDDGGDYAWRDSDEDDENDDDVDAPPPSPPRPTKSKRLKSTAKGSNAANFRPAPKPWCQGELRFGCTTGTTPTALNVAAC